jgi:hypothetical protein
MLWLWIGQFVALLGIVLIVVIVIGGIIRHRHPGEKTLEHPLGDPRLGDDRRRQERRIREMSPDEVDDWLKRNGIFGGDRRRGERRKGDRRR